MDSSKLREDIVSPLLKVSTYKGFTLTGPKDAITRRVMSSQSISPGDTAFTQLNFRLLGTSPSCMLDARVRLVVPLRFSRPVSNNAAGNGEVAAGAEGWDLCNVGPRRNGLLKSFSTLSTIINNTTSFSVRPDESLAAAEQAFPQCREFGFTGSNNTEEGGWWGPDWTGNGTIATRNNAPANFPIGDLKRLGLIHTSNPQAANNRAAAERTAEFLLALKRDGANALYDNVNRRMEIEYDYTTELFIPPFKKFDYPTVSKAPTYIPYADQIEVACHWKSLGEIKANLLLGKGRNESLGGGADGRCLTDYTLAYAGQPYIDCSYVVPNYSLPPVVTLPCFRTIHYQEDVVFAEDTADNTIALAEGTGVHKKVITMAPIRIESLPSLVFVWVSDTSIPAASGGVPGFHLREYFGKITDFSVTMNERIRIMSDRSTKDLYRLYRMYCPNSKLDFFTWSELRQLIVFRSDILCTDASQSVFAPTTITFKMSIQRAIQNRQRNRSACTQRIHVLFWYANEAVSLSSQSSSVTSLLLNPSDVRNVRVGAGSSAITELMARNQ